MTNKLIQTALVVFLAFMHAGASAEDIDLFTAPPGQGANVLIMLDNTSNWSAANQGWAGGIKQGQAELAALKQVINSLAPADKDSPLNVGLMMLTSTSSSPAGAYVRSAMKPMTAANRAAFATLLDTIYANYDDPSEKVSSSMDYDRAMFEIFKYFGGYTSPANANTNVAGSPVSTTHFGPLRRAQADPKTDPNAFVDPTTKLTYKPASETADACPRKNYLVFIGNGFPNETSSNGAELLPNVGGNTTQIYNENPLNKNRFTDEWARFLYQTDVSSTSGKQNVITYTINVYKDQPSAEQGRLLTSMAKVGGGTAFVATSSAAIVDALTRIISEIQSENSAFASASLPVSVNAQGTYLNQIFIGMFRPVKEPRWFGNLKQYQFKAEVDASGKVIGLTTADKNNAPAINAINGFITPCAESFWSTTETPFYWPSGYLGNCLSGDARSNSPDGEIVEKGGAAQKLRALSGATAVSARNVKTCSTCGSGALEDFNNANSAITKTLLGNDSMTNANRTDLINWARGLNNNGDAADAFRAATDVRPSVHGDVVHSRPVAIDYGGTTGVVVFYGGNDGMLRAIDGSKVDTGGKELWSFVAPDHYGKFNRLKSNSPLVSFPGVSTVSPEATPTPKDYFFDGPIGVYRSSDKTNTWIYPTMRRGGSAVYAFNVSTPGTSAIPVMPTLKWKRDGTQLTNQLTNIGQTWSEPKVAKVAGYPSIAASVKTPVLIMGGGYDPCEDQDAAPNTACVTPRGNRIYVLDADDGSVIQTLGTGEGDNDAILRSVAADVTVVDSDGDGLADYAYAVDTGANVYRINIGANTSGNWTIKKIASLGCTGTAACNRKFLFAPEVVVTADYNAVLVGSGNRERPLLSNQATTVDNAFFMIKDDRSLSPTLITTSAMVSINADVALTDAEKTALASSTNKGWYLDFSKGDHDKEQVVTSAAVIAGVVYFSTHTPTEPTACGSNLGLARGYAVSFLDSSARDEGFRYGTFGGGGLPPSPVVGIVEVAAANPDGSTRTVKVPFVIGGKAPEGTGGSGLGGQMANVNVSGVRSRVYWYIQQ